MGNLSSHFSLDEFRPKGTPPGWNPLATQRNRLKKLADKLELLRAACGNQPIHITSGARTPEHNEQVGGASRSRHLYDPASGHWCDGCDGYIVGVPHLEVCKKALLVGFGGIGCYDDHWHLDIREGKPARWGNPTGWWL